MTQRPFDLTIDPAVAYRIAELAREFTAEDYGPQPDDDERESDPVQYDEAELDEDVNAGPVDPVHAELTGVIEALDIDELRDLLALIWLGRGDFDGRWDAARRQARETESLHLISYLEQTPLADEYLSQALDQLGYPAEEYGQQ